MGAEEGLRPAIQQGSDAHAGMVRATRMRVHELANAGSGTCWSGKGKKGTPPLGWSWLSVSPGSARGKDVVWCRVAQVQSTATLGGSTRQACAIPQMHSQAPFLDALCVGRGRHMMR